MPFSYHSLTLVPHDKQVGSAIRSWIVKPKTWLCRSSTVPSSTFEFDKVKPPHSRHSSWTNWLPLKGDSRFQEH